MKLSIENKEFIELVNGRVPVASRWDYHSSHITDHLRILSDPSFKSCPEVVEAVLHHIEDHMEINRTCMIERALSEEYYEG